MPRQFYYFATFLFAVLILQEVLITSVLTTAGAGIYSLNSFISYFTLVSVTQAFCGLIVVQYCYSQQYIWPLRAGWLGLVCLSVHTAVVYEILVNRNLESWYYYSYSAVSAANVLLGISLVVSKSRGRFWLKWIGLALICIDTAQIALLIWYNVFADFQMKAALSQVNLVLSWLVLLVTVRTTAERTGGTMQHRFKAPMRRY